MDIITFVGLIVALVLILAGTIIDEHKDRKERMKLQETIHELVYSQKMCEAALENLADTITDLINKEND